MRVEARIGLSDQRPIELPFARAALIAGDEQHRPPSRIEREGHAPDSAASVEPQLLHVRVPRPFERIDARSPDHWPEPFEHVGLGQKLNANRSRQSPQLPLERGMQDDRPHLANMLYKEYAVKGILAKIRYSF